MTGNNFHSKLKLQIHSYILLTYKSTKKYPSHELFGLTSQDRRAAVSIMLNYVEGFARHRPAVMLNFYEISFGSLKESIYARFLGKELGYITIVEYQEAFSLKEEIAAMLFTTIEGMRKDAGR